MAREEIEIEGFVGKDPKRGKNKASEMLSFPVGVTQSSKNKASGEWENSTTWYDVEIWNPNQVAYWENKIADISKGSKVMVRGKPKVRAYLNQANLPMAHISILVGDIITMQGKRNESNNKPAQSNHPKYTKQPANTMDDFIDDDIPF